MTFLGESNVPRAAFFKTRAALTLDEPRDELTDLLHRDVKHGAFAQRVVAMIDRVGAQELARAIH